MKVGDFVRTRWGCIAKFEGIHEGFYEFDNIIMDESSAVREELFVDIVEKSSPNIIDLIEVGDYVNGVRVEEVLKKGDLCFIYLENGFDDVDNDYVLEYGIVTKEMYSSVEYRVENKIYP